MHEMALTQLDAKSAKIVLILNICIPGSGTIFAGIKVKGDVMINNIIMGLLQMVLTPFFLIGWFWPLILGLQIYSRRRDQNTIVDHKYAPGTPGGNI